ncbi:MAG TPA: hypothetical protein VGP60_11435, partial [Amycolatopsis sp.]|nr:hypothetical protein [Amycolatopsis sp.]
ARIRALGERAVATLKTWKILVKLRCCPRLDFTQVDGGPSTIDGRGTGESSPSSTRNRPSAR